MKSSLFSLLFTFCIGLFTNAQTIIDSEIDFVAINPSGLTVTWTNAINANSYIRYGKTPDLELGVINGGTASNPSISITGTNPSEVFYVQAVAEENGTIDESDTLVCISQSLSSGDMLVYFNQWVDHDYAHPNNEAVYLPQTIDDTLVAYINRAQESIDVAIYNTTSSSSVADYIGALNQAYANGVQVRVIYNGDTGNTGIAELNPAIPKLESPDADFQAGIGIMHNKFFVFDANAADPNLPLVWTGSTNLTTQQINTDANHAVIIQDRSLAIAYEMEFEEMWGSTGINPDFANSRLGAAKTDNTPHVFNINGSRVECYFSPSDQTNSRILKAINEANDDLLVNTMLITKSDLANEIITKHNEGSNVAVLVNTESQSSTFNTMRNSLSGRLGEYTGVTGILHHKTMLANAISNLNPYVLTGSHNWSASAEERNDENTLVIYNESIVNQFFQEYMARYKPILSQLEAVNDTVLISSGNIELISVSENDDAYFTIEPNIYVLSPPQNGVANGSNLGIVAYIADEGYLGPDSLQYITCNETIESYCDTAWVQINVDYELGVDESSINQAIRVYPIPATEQLSVEVTNGTLHKFKLTDLSGKQIQSKKFNSPQEVTSISVSELKSGVYLIYLETTNEIVTQKIIIQ